MTQVCHSQLLNIYLNSTQTQRFVVACQHWQSIVRWMLTLSLTTQAAKTGMAVLQMRGRQ